ncbi:MAG: phosphotransferase [Actinomycetota bacterium]|nr:phosphotransferase [Actinomycetota bacterium]
MPEPAVSAPTDVDDWAATGNLSGGAVGGYLGDAADAIVREALTAAGATVLGASIVSTEPRGRGAIVGVEAEIVTDDGTERRTCYVDDSRSPAEIWVHPDDPRLPALAAATFPHALATLLARVGLAGDLDDVELVAYRPGRRAVVRAGLGDRTVFAKVVRPERAEAIVERHRMLRGAGLPVPGVLGWSPAGVVVLEAAAGVALDSVAGDIDPSAVVSAIDGLRSRLASIDGLAASVRPSVPSRASWYATRLGDRMPRLAERLRPLVSFAANAGTDTRYVAVHGDLHAGQLFIDHASAQVTGLIDVDTLALGDVGTDVGAFLAHALASAELVRAAGDVHRAAGFEDLARHGAATWLEASTPNESDAGTVLSARRHTVGQLLAQAMQLAGGHGLEQSADRLVRAAERVVNDEEALI